MLIMISATEYALPAIEIVDSRIENWNIKLCRHGGGQRLQRPVCTRWAPRSSLSDIDLTACAMEMKRGEESRLARQWPGLPGQPAQCGGLAGRHVMVRCGRPLLAGDIVLTGALGPMVAVQSEADRFDVQYRRPRQQSARLFA